MQAPEQVNQIDAKSDKKKTKLKEKPWFQGTVLVAGLVLIGIALANIIISQTEKDMKDSNKRFLITTGVLIFILGAICTGFGGFKVYKNRQKFGFK
jgi:hypothetical protein